MLGNILMEFNNLPGIRWIDSYLACKACGNHILCGYHQAWLNKELSKNKFKCTDRKHCEMC